MLGTKVIKAEIPVEGKAYNAFDDGKVSVSRRIELYVDRIIPFGNAPEKVLEFWRNERKECERIHLFADKTDYFVEGHFLEFEDGDLKRYTVYFCRDVNGGWYSFEGANCRLDVDNRMSVMALFSTVECLWEKIVELEKAKGRK